MARMVERIAGWLNIHVLWRRGWGLGKSYVGNETHWHLRMRRR
jgi:hypothetical protein